MLRLHAFHVVRTSLKFFQLFAQLGDFHLLRLILGLKFLDDRFKFITLSLELLEGLQLLFVVGSFLFHYSELGIKFFELAINCTALPLALGCRERGPRTRGCGSRRSHRLS